ncbi:MAG: DNA starvation/stationary phase protection protein [Candidatus Brocadia sp. WS118]|nr:MAG: DNA starvation/stationary phase protection protein [Candidatus Brocadia sp. WS118]
MDKVNIGIPEKNRQGVVDVLGRILADQYILYTKTRNYHWNVTGENFSEYHKLFEEQYDAIDEDIDAVAERIRALGGKTPATLAEFGKTARLREHPGTYPKARVMVANLLADHEATIQNLRKAADICDDKYGDSGTEDFLTQLMEKHEKTAWMLRAILAN